jgi:PPOX class probable F420-dependent enzyme
MERDGAGNTGDAALSARALAFLEPARFAALATVNADGSPHQTVIWYLLRDGQLVINSLVGRRWPSNLRRDPRFSLLIEDGLDYVALSGTVVEEPSAEQAQHDIAAMARRYNTPDDAERMIETRFRPQRRVSFVLRPTRTNEHWEG